MKNISRRTFIKGMAVAAAATAASTVLAGCNMVPAVEEPVAGFQSQTKTLDFGDDKVVTLTTTSYAITYDKKIKVGMTMVNDAGQALAFGTSSIEVNAYFNGEHIAKQAVNGDESMMWAHNGNKYYECNTEVGGVEKTYTHKGYFYFDQPEDWSTMTLVFHATVNGKTKEVQFNLSK